MRQWNKMFGLCLTGTLLLTAGVLWLPRYFSRGLDQKKLGRVEAAGRENFSFLEQGDNGILEANRAFSYLDQEEGDLTLLSSYDDPEKVSTDLISNVYAQTMEAADAGVLPWLGEGGYRIYESGIYDAEVKVEPYEYWGGQVDFARCYSLTYPSASNSHVKRILKFWYLRFTHELFDYSFVVNAETYQIYYAEIYNALTDRLILSNGKDENYWSFLLNFTVGCQDYYGADSCYMTKIEDPNELTEKTEESDAQTQTIAECVMAFDLENIEIKQEAVQNHTKYKGVRVGLGNLSENIQMLVE
jgi:hypothetical protein